MKLDIDGTFYEWDFDSLTLAEAFEVKDQTGWGLRSWVSAVEEREPAAIAFVAYLARKRAGERLDWRASVQNLTPFMESLTASQESPDPTEAQTGSG